MPRWTAHRRAFIAAIDPQEIAGTDPPEPLLARHLRELADRIEAEGIPPHGEFLTIRTPDGRKVGLAGWA